MQLSLPFHITPEEDLSTIFERMKACKTLPILSPLASQILKLCRHEETTAEELAEMLSQDPGMAAQILYMANSGYYGGSRHKVTHMVQAVTLVGFSSIAKLALSFCFYRLMKDMKNPAISGLDHERFWRRSILASIAARALGTHFAVSDVELSFLGALLQDIGILALQEIAPNEVRDLYTQEQDHALLGQGEFEQVGVDHPQVGAWLAQHWSLPEEFQVVILYSHTPELFEAPRDFQLLVDTVALAGPIADLWMNPYTEQAIEMVHGKSQGRLTVQSHDWKPIFDQIMAEIPKVASFFHTRLGNFDDIIHIHRLALKHLSHPRPTQFI